MTPRRLVDCMNVLGWTQRGAAQQLQRPDVTVQRWMRGTVAIPPEVATRLEELVRSAATGGSERGTLSPPKSACSRRRR